MAEGGDRSSSEQPTSPDAARVSDADGPGNEGADAGDERAVEPAQTDEAPAVDPAVEKQFDAVIHSDVSWMRSHTQTHN